MCVFYVNDYVNVLNRGSNLYVWEREYKVFTKLVMFTLVCLLIYFHNINALLTQLFLSYHKIDIICHVTWYKHTRMGPYWLSFSCTLNSYSLVYVLSAFHLCRLTFSEAEPSFTFSHLLNKYVYRFWTFSFYVSHCCSLDRGGFLFSDPFIPCSFQIPAFIHVVPLLSVHVEVVSWTWLTCT